MTKAIALFVLAVAAWPVAAQEREIVIKERTFGCRTPEETQRFYHMALKDRKEEAAKYASEKKCRMFAGGDKVAIVEPLPVIAQNGVRYKDDPNVYYLPAAAAR